MSELPQIPDGFRKQQRNGVTKISWRFDRNWFQVLINTLGLVVFGLVMWKLIMPEVLRRFSTDVELSQWEILHDSILTSEFWSNKFSLLFVCFSLFLLAGIYRGLVHLLNRSTLTFSQKTVKLTHGPLPWISKGKLETSDIDLFYKEKSRSGKVRYALFAKLHNNKRIKLISVSYLRRTSHGIDYLVTELNAALDK